MRIFVIDSGIGGLSVLKVLKKKYPSCDFVYLAENANHPYGEKTDEEIKFAVKNAIESLSISKSDILFVACNTASIVAKEEIEKYPFETHFVMPNIEKINSFLGNTLLLATNRTVERIKGKLSQNVFAYSPPSLPYIIENASSDKEILAEIEKIKELFGDEYRNVVLACTHFSLKRNLFEKVFCDKNIIDVVDDCENIDLFKSGSFAFSEEPSITFKTTNPSIDKLVKMGDLLARID